MADISIATPGSTADSGTPAKTSASKDRSCPYCHTNFTSSSLGRHLDLFIKEKNPKPPDGIHDVDAIRRSRGNITRRQARTSSAKREGSVASSSKPTPTHGHKSPSFSKAFMNGDHSDRPTGMSLNRAGWEATGVINDIPSATRDNRYNSRREQPRRLLSKMEMDQKKKALEDRDRGRAAELALREILDSIKAANARAHPKSPYQFDFFDQSFPGLCLRFLTSPNITATSQIVPSETSWPVTVPGHAQLEVLRTRVEMTLKWWHSQVRDAARIASVGSLGTNSKPANIDGDKADDQLYFEHLEKSYKLWVGLPESQKKDLWHIEVMQAFIRESKAHGKTHVELDKAETEAANLRIQLDRLNECQQPREYLLFPPNQLPISRETANLVASDSQNMPLDYEKLVEKWKARIQTNRSTQKSLPPPTHSTPMSAHHTNGVSGYAPDHMIDDPQLQDGASEDDLMDAPGEEDDELNGQVRVPTATMERGILDPSLREHGPDEVMDGIEGDGDGYGSGRLLATLREYAAANGKGL